MVMAICCGLDGAIVNSLDRRMMGCIVTAETVMGRELYCMNYLKAYRAGKFACHFCICCRLILEMRLYVPVSANLIC
jgi:hypothetical protein